MKYCSILWVHYIIGYNEVAIINVNTTAEWTIHVTELFNNVQYEVK